MIIEVELSCERENCNVHDTHAYAVRNIIDGDIMVTTLAHFTTTALVPDAHVCNANQPDQFSNYILLIN